MVLHPNRLERRRIAYMFAIISQAVRNHVWVAVYTINKAGEYLSMMTPRCRGREHACMMVVEQQQVPTREPRAQLSLYAMNNVSI
jgi:hypothetical protein